MGYDPAKYHRRSLRLKDYDYSQPGLYFVTICCYQRQPLFDVPEVHQIGMEAWQHLPNRFPTVTLDLFVIMPDHVHGILQLHRPPRQTKAPRLDEIVRVYKSITSVQWLQLNKGEGRYVIDTSGKNASMTTSFGTTWMLSGYANIS